MSTNIDVISRIKKMRPTHFSRIILTANADHIINPERAFKLTEQYRHSVPPDSRVGGFFGKQIIAKLLTQESVVGIRIYFAEEDNGKPTFVMVGVDQNNRDLFRGLLAGFPVMSCVSLVARTALPDADLSTPSVGTFSARRNHSICLHKAGQLTLNFRRSPRFTSMKGGFFARSIFNRILSEQGCVGIVVYHGLKEDGNLTFVLAGIDDQGHHHAKWPFGDDVLPCPPFCSAKNSLNS
jgi:hypothetical protein